MINSSSPRPLRVGAFSVILTCAVAAGACSAKPSLFDSLLNQGMIPVSADNPYVGSNLFLAKEMEKSSYLYNFFKSKGPPQAIELRGHDERSAEVLLFYAKHREMYVARPHLEPQFKTKEWIVRGPYAVERAYFKQVSRLTVEEAAVFEVWGRKEHFGTWAQPVLVREIEPAFVPTATPRPTPRPRPRTKVIHATPAPTAAPAPINFDQQALLDAKEMAERTPKGDLVHIVKQPNETLQSIANWYTGTADNAKAIGDKNELPGDVVLRPGNRVIVPAEIVTNPKTMK